VEWGGEASVPEYHFISKWINCVLDTYEQSLAGDWYSGFKAQGGKLGVSQDRGDLELEVEHDGAGKLRTSLVKLRL
jgi:hypothetical protein